jgi:hypothetical protein
MENREQLAALRKPAGLRRSRRLLGTALARRFLSGQASLLVSKGTALKWEANDYRAPQRTVSVRTYMKPFCSEPFFAYRCRRCGSFLF